MDRKGHPVKDIDLVSLLVKINRKSPPKPELCVELGQLIASDPEFFQQPGGVNRFDRPGYGYSAQVEREPIFLLVFVVADLVREGLRPEYLRKLFQCYQEHPEWFGLPKEPF